MSEGLRGTLNSWASNTLGRARFARWSRDASLLTASAFTLLGLIGFGILAWLAIGFITIGGFTWEISSGGINRAAATQIVLTMVAGGGGVVALVVTYRKQQRLEDGHFLESLGAAAAQLGDDKPAVQFSGIYALAALADESDAQRRQQCIEVLCGYIRTPYDPRTTGQVGIHTRTEKFQRPENGEIVETTITKEYKPGEKEVRSTIFRVIRDHLRDDSTVPWTGSSLDLSGAVIDYCDLSDIIIPLSATFARATFLGDVSFHNAKFLNDSSADFTGAKFARGKIDFSFATFGGSPIASADFAGAQFCGSEVNFAGARFCSQGKVSFEGAEFSSGSVSFSYATFSSDIFLGHAIYSGAKVEFAGAKLNKGTIDFSESFFRGGSVDFGGKDAGREPARFLGGTVIFTAPFDWSAPPIVPWADGEKPLNGVLPQNWPPQLKRPARPR